MIGMAMAGSFAAIKKCLGQSARRLRRDERGVTAVEFAFLGLPFFGIIAAIMQTSVIFLASQVLESAVQDASREIRTGQLSQSRGTIETFRSSVCDRLYGLFPDCEGGLYVQVSDIKKFERANVTPPVDADCELPCDWNRAEEFAPGEGRSVILAQVYYRYPVFIPLGPLGMANLNDGTRLMGSVALFQNEPFN
jgi:Flp pilus assembly pilin Flp